MYKTLGIAVNQNIGQSSTNLLTEELLKSSRISLPIFHISVCDWQQSSVPDWIIVKYAAPLFSGAWIWGKN